MNSNSSIYLFTTFTIRYRDNLDKLMKAIGLHGGQVFVLNMLWQNDGPSQADLSKSLQLAPPTIYNMVKRLAETGFVKIVRDQTDTRVMRVFLTEKGLGIKDEVQRQWHELERQTFSNLSETEKMMFSMLLEKVVGEQT